MNPAQSDERKPAAIDRRTLLVFLLLLLVAVIARIPALDGSLVERHDFRQTQTAYTALEFHRNGIDLAHSPLPVMGNGDLPFEFPLFQALASVPMSWGISPDTAMRSTGLFCFALTAIALFAFARRAFGDKTALIASLLFVASPFSMQWAKASLIEFLATACALTWAWATLRWKQQAQWWFLPVAAAFGSLATTVKITTAVGWLLVVAGIVFWKMHETWTESHRAQVAIGRAIIPGSVVVVTPLLLGSIWNKYADHIRENDPMVQWLSVANLHEWTYGTLQQRLDWSNWQLLSQRLETLTYIGGAAMLIVAAAVFSRTQPRVLAVSVLLSIAVPPLIFFNLYAVHDYYLCAISPQIAITLAGAVCWLATRYAAARMTRPMIAVAVTIAALSAYLQSNYWYATSRVKGHVPAYSQQLIDHTTDADRTVLSGFDWNPTVPYYAERNVEMLPTKELGRELYERVSARPIGAMMLTKPLPDLAMTLRNYSTISSVSANVIRTSAVSTSPLIASNEAPPQSGNSSVRSLPPIKLQCNSSASIPKGIYEVTSTNADQWIAVSKDFSPVPLRRYVTLNDDQPNLTCVYGGELTLTRQ